MEDKPIKRLSDLNVTSESQSPPNNRGNRPRQMSSKMSNLMNNTNQSDDDETYSDIERVRAKKKDK